MSRKTDQLVPEHVWRVTMHYHDLVYIRSFWESIGQIVPQPFLDELERTHKVLIKVLEDENSQGGAFRKGDDDEAR